MLRPEKELIKMDKIAEVKQVVRHDNWKRMYEEYQRSGMKVNDWCVMQGLSVKTFYYRLKVIRGELLNETNQHDIVPVMKCKTEMPSDMSTTKSDEKIHITGNGINIELPETVSVELMTAILRGMRSC